MKRKMLVASGLISVVVLSLIFLRPAEAQQEADFTEDPLHPLLVFQADSSANTINEAFMQAGMDYYPEDIVTAFPDPKLGLGSVVTVQRALPIPIQDGKRRFTIRTWQRTVGEALKEKNIELGDEDRISPTLNTLLQMNMPIVITRVARTTVTEIETVDFKTVEQDDPNSYRGTNTVVQEGSNGQIEYKYLLIREDGELISKTLTSTTITKKVVNKIIKIGSKLRIGETYFGKATWYVNSYGTKVAMDLFPAGTEVRITNLNTGKSIIVVNDGCICGATGVLVDLAPEYFQALGGTLGQGVLQNIRVEEIL
jgi:hypothetical protein